MGVEFFCYHRDRPGSVALRLELQEEHLSCMDRYAAEMIARGPTFAADGGIPTGSVHIVDLPDPFAARAFAFDEPNYQAGVRRHRGALLAIRRAAVVTLRTHVALRSDDGVEVGILGGDIVVRRAGWLARGLRESCPGLAPNGVSGRQDQLTDHPDRHRHAHGSSANGCDTTRGGTAP